MREGSSIEAKVDKLENIVTNTFENSHELLNNTITILENRLNIKERENSILLEIIAKLNRDKPFKNWKKDIFKNQKENKHELIAEVEDNKRHALETELPDTGESLNEEQNLILMEKMKCEEEYNKEESEEDMITHVQMEILFKDGWERDESQMVDDKLEISDLTTLSEKKVNI